MVCNNSQNSNSTTTGYTKQETDQKLKGFYNLLYRQANKFVVGVTALTKTRSEDDEPIAVSASEALYTEKVIFFEDYLDASKTEDAPGGSVEAAFDALLTDYPNLIPGLAKAARRKQITSVLVSREVSIDFDLATHYNLEFAFAGEGMLKATGGAQIVIGRMALTGARQIFDCEAGSSITLGNKAVSGSVYHLEWWTGAADEDEFIEAVGIVSAEDRTAVDATGGLRMARQSVINNYGGTIKLGTGNFETTERFNPSIGMIVEGSGANSYGKKNPQNAGVSGAVGGGTNLIYKGAEDEFFYLGDLNGGANNTRTVQLKNLNVDARGTPAAAFSIQGANQNIYGVRCEEVVFLSSAKYAFDINVQNAAQVEEVMFDHCEFIGSVGSEGSFRCNTNNGTNLFTQCYFATPPNKDCLFINKCGTTNLLNCHLVGGNTADANSPVLEGRAGVYFGFINGGQPNVQGVDITNFTMIGCQDEALNYSIISEAFQVPHPSTLIGNLFQGNILLRGRHTFVTEGCTFWGRAWRDTPHDITDPLDARYARHPFVPDGAGGLAFANSRVYSRGDHFGGNRSVPMELVIDPITRRSSYAPLPAWGQPDKFHLDYSYSEVISFDDPVNDVHMQRGTVRNWINYKSKWKQFETFEQNTPIASWGSNQPDRAAMEIATTEIDPNTRIERSVGYWRAWRDTTLGDLHWESNQKSPYNNLRVRGGVLAGEAIEDIQGAYTFNQVIVKGDGTRYQKDDNGRHFCCVGATTFRIPKPTLTAAEIAAFAYPDKPPLEVERGTMFTLTRHGAGAVTVQLSAAAIADGCALLLNGAFANSFNISAQYKRFTVRQYYPKIFRITED